MIYKIKQLIYGCKILTYRFIQMTGAHFIYQWVDNYKFRKLKRTQPELLWKALPRCPVVRYDAGGLQIKNKLYVFGGFTSEMPFVLNQVDVFDLDQDKWVEQFPIPEEMAQSHLSACVEADRYIYIFGGQLGPFCYPSTRNCFVLDTQTNQWHSFVALPEERYSLSAHLIDGRIHLFGGSKPDRDTPALSHWSIAVKDGQSLEDKWQEEPLELKRGGPHRGSDQVDGKVYFLGGQEGDVLPVPDDPRYHPDFSLNSDLIYPDTYVYDNSQQLIKRVADMPVTLSHTEFSTLVIGEKILVLGGQLERNKKGDCRISDVIQCYDTKADTWSVIGHLPYCTKTVVVAYHNGYLYFTTGQIAKSRSENLATSYDNRMWKAKWPQ